MPDWASLLTEQRNPASDHLDEMSTLELVELMNREDAIVPQAVRAVLPAVARAVDLVAASLCAGGRLFYLGAGSSGRLGILDAAECPPTYSTDPQQVQGLIAGGERAVFGAVEGAEDDADAARVELAARRAAPPDAVVGIAASGVTPWVVGGLRYARQQGCATVFFTCSPSAAAAIDTDVKIVPEVGPEVVTGSTRMKAGTATKLVLNAITTGAMVRLGKTYGNLMVDLQPNNAKLRDRAVRILASLANLEVADARGRLAAAGNDLKLALVIALSGLGTGTARQLLDRSGGRVKAAVSAAPCAEAEG